MPIAKRTARIRVTENTPQTQTHRQNDAIIRALRDIRMTLEQVCDAIDDIVKQLQ